MVLQADDGRGILYRSNHYHSDKLSHLNPDPNEYCSTYRRSERIHELLEERYGKLRFQDLFRIMSDHEHGVFGVCRHPRENAPGRTVSASMFVIEDFEAWTVLGNPCEQLPHVALRTRK
jgi:hypothetical protein